MVSATLILYNLTSFDFIFSLIEIGAETTMRKQYKFYVESYYFYEEAILFLKCNHTTKVIC